MTYRQAVAKSVASPKIHCWCFSSDEELKQYLASLATDTRSAGPKDVPAAMELFLDRYGDEVAHLFNALKSNFGQMGLMDVSDYASFLDVFAKSVYIKDPPSTESAQVLDDNDENEPL